MSERIEDLIEFRKKKLAKLKELGIDPYPSKTNRTHTNKHALDNFDELAAKGTHVSLVGRIKSWRDNGKITFANIEDGTAKIQVFFKADLLPEKYELLKLFDIGDFIEVTGILFTTKTGEKTLQAQDVRMLAKSLRPMPSEYYGLSDMELRLRKRYLDLMMNPEVREMFEKKTRFWHAVQEFMIKRGFLQVEAPVLEPIPGGAEAEPFVTHHKALDRDFYLRISLELPLKKMIVGGYEKVFEIGRIFRNEGISTEHLQDYTQMEFYWAYAGFDEMMHLVRELYQHAIKEAFGTLQLPYQGDVVDWSGDWEKVDYGKLFKEHTGMDVRTVSEEELQKYCDKHHVKYEEFAGRGRLIDLVFKKTIRPKIPMDKPKFLVNQPIELEPLAKKDPLDPKIVQRMQILACGSELGKGFGELNDPLDQRERFEFQQSLREKGDTEAQMLDEDYLEAMEYGMPPLAGFGMSERVFAVLMDKSVRETVIFPPMKE